MSGPIQRFAFKIENDKLGKGLVLGDILEIIRNMKGTVRLCQSGPTWYNWHTTNEEAVTYLQELQKRKDIIMWDRDKIMQVSFGRSMCDKNNHLQTKNN